MKKYNYNLPFQLALLFMAIILFSCESDDSMIDEMEDPEYTLMSIVLNGQEYDRLTNAAIRFGVPFEYMQVSTSINDPDLKWITLQGDHADFQINLHIPRQYWGTGEFELEEGSTDFGFGDLCRVHYITPGPGFNNDITGSLTITEFDIEDRILNGNFSFSDDTVSVVGTLNYPLDDEEFD